MKAGFSYFWVRSRFAQERSDCGAKRNPLDALGIAS